ncbi:uncharacterized protein LOC114319392 [Camellia sinensis]|uniref:uncharacterized protein LOC114319392 n=1 Tax=Camellia sinensis TaxID=4442 RepID=UPI001036CA71|nr:uncharacterized protein LOC114319392 [Camellia sinensis]
MVTPTLMDRELARLTATPLSPEIESTALPAGFHQPKFTRYDGKTDPYMHVSHYRQVMAGYRHNDALMCLIFPVSLGELGLKWFERLPERSIVGWQQLAEAFVTRFKTNTRTPKEVDHFLSVKMESGGSLKAYNGKYWETYNEILDYPTNLAIAQYKREDDAATASTTEKANPVRVDRRVVGKVHSVGQKDNRPNNQARDQHRCSNRNDRNKNHGNDRANTPHSEEEDAKRKLKAQTGITIVFKIPIYLILSEIRGEPYMRWPTKLGDTQRGFNSRYRYTFYKENGH